MSVTFIEPMYLWWLLALAPLLALGWLGSTRMGRGRRIGSLLLRTLVVIALIGSLAGTQLMQPVRELTTIFLLDASDSVTPSQRAAQEQFVAEALRTMPQDDRAALIVFGENALIERLPSHDRTLGNLQSVPIVSRTNLEQAVTLGLALFPADTQKRLVLLSDGGENVGRVLNAVRLAHNRHVSIDVVPPGIATGAEVALVSLRVPTQARAGQELALIATMESSVAQAGQLRILVDQQIVHEVAVQLPAGSSSYTSTIILDQPGYHQVSAQISPSDDTRRQNNESTVLVQIKGQPSVLIVAGEPLDGRNVARALEAAKITATVVGPLNMPTTLGGLADYEAVVLANVPARLLANETQRLLQSFVRDLGRGVVMLGGENSYGIGGYTGTPIEELLPVEMQLRNREKFPPVSVAIVFDISGSMSEEVGGRQKVQLAAEGAARVVHLLRDFDELTVIPFDSAPQNPFGPVSGNERETAEDEIIARGVVGGGGINIHDGLRAAGTTLKPRTAAIRHIIMLADGADSQQQEGSLQLAKEYLDQGITTSVVAIGNGGDVPFLERLARAGSGRFFLVDNAAVLPDIMLQEAQLSFAPYLVEETFQPLLGADTPILATLLDQPWPNLHGYNGTLAKENARVALYALDEAPLLAQWQYGLGRSVAWTSDMKGKWGRDLVQWDQFPRLIAQMIGWTLPTLSSDTITIDSSFIGTELEVTVSASDDAGAALSGLVVTTQVVGDDGVQGGLVLQEIGAGLYQGRLLSPSTGTYFLQVGGRTSDGQDVFQRSLGIVVPYSPEYRQGQSNINLLTVLAEQSGGRILTLPAASFDHTLDQVQRATPIAFPLLLLALLLLPLDIALRRVRLSRGRLALPRRAQTVPQSGPVLGGLAQAKDRARTRFDQPGPPAISEAPPRADAPVYQAAAPPPPRPVQAAPPAGPEPAVTSSASPAPTPSRSAAEPSLDEITDPLERLRAAKNRARRR